MWEERHAWKALGFRDTRSAHHSGWSKNTNTEEGQGDGVLKTPSKRARTLSSCA